MSDVFDEAGSLRGAYAAIDWSATSLGPVESWSATLLALTDLALNTEFAVTLLWGPDFTMIYNEAYVPIIGDKHPAALGAPAREVFPEIWDEIGPMMQGVRDGNGPVWMPDIRLLIDRHGFAEETFFQFCYSPVGQHNGAIEGVVDIVSETTQRTIAQRRLELLTRLTQRLTAEFASPRDVIDAALPLLRSNHLDLRAVDILFPDDSSDAVAGNPGDGRPSGPKNLPTVVPDGPWSGDVLVQSTTAGNVARVQIPTSTDIPTRAQQPLLAVLLSDNLTFDDEYRSFLQLIASNIAQSLDRIAVRTAERRMLQVQGELSEALQRSLLTTPLEPDHLHIAVRYQPAVDQARIGGDWYDSFLLPSGALTVVIGDVAGHDAHAAAAMAQVRNYLRGFAYISDLTPAETLSSLDRAMQGLASGTLATAVVATVEQTPQQAAEGLRTLRWSNAGHPPPLLVTAAGQTSFLETEPETLLGVAPDVTRTDHTLLLEPDSSVLFYTDGLIEHPGQDLTDGLAALAAHLRHTQNMSAEQLCDHVLNHLGPTAQDDVALLVIHAYSEAEPRPAEAGPTVLPTDLLPSNT